MKKTLLNRRALIAYGMAIPVAGFIGCGGAGSAGVVTNDADSGTDTSSGSGTYSDSGSDTDTGTSSGETGAWAVGGTELITVDYPDDSIFETAAVCTVSLTNSTTLGPCYFQDSTGEDISTGLTGLPMQLCLQLIDSNCQPLANHTIEIWHCDTAGIYSGDTSSSNDSSSFAGSFCTGGDSAASNSSWYRGQLTTDSSGRVNFKTCFPGWYRGRTIHIHFAVSNASSNRQVISQFCFTDALAKEICTTNALYSARGEQDTTLAGGSDSVFPRSGYEDYLLTTEQNSDGTLLAYHTIQIA